MLSSSNAFRANVSWELHGTDDQTRRTVFDIRIRDYRNEELFFKLSLRKEICIINSFRADFVLLNRYCWERWGRSITSFSSSTTFHLLCADVAEECECVHHVSPSKLKHWIDSNYYGSDSNGRDHSFTTKCLIILIKIHLPFLGSNSGDRKLLYSIPGSVRMNSNQQSSEATEEMWKVSGNKVMHTDPSEFLSRLHTQRTLVLVNTGNIPLNIHSLALLPDEQYDSQAPVSSSRVEDFFHKLECSVNGFSLNPCLLPGGQVFSSEQLSGLHNGQLVLEAHRNLTFSISHHPDFVRILTSAQLVVVSHPLKPVHFADCQGDNLTFKCQSTLSQSRGYVHLKARFNPDLLMLCQQAIVRPWFEPIFRWVFRVPHTDESFDRKRHWFTTRVPLIIA